MARFFNRATSEYLEADSAPVAAMPLTLACWFYTDDLNVDQTLIWLGDKDVGAHYHALQMRGNAAGDKVIAETAGTGGFRQVPVTSTGASANTWHHACGVWAAADDRRVYIDGGSKGTNADSITPVGHDRVSIGGNRDDSPGDYMSGRIAEAAIWNVALDDDEVAALAAGFSPLLVRPASVAFYVPLVRDDDEDIVGGVSLTAFNTPTIAVHSRVFYPTRPQIIMAPVAAPGGLPLPVAMHHYTKIIGAR